MEVLRLREFRLRFIAQRSRGWGPIALAFAVLELGASATAVGLALTAVVGPGWALAVHAASFGSAPRPDLHAGGSAPALVAV